MKYIMTAATIIIHQEFVHELNISYHLSTLYGKYFFVILLLG